VLFQSVEDAVKFIKFSASVVFFCLCFSLTAISGDSAAIVNKVASKKAAVAGCALKSVSCETAKQAPAPAVTQKPSPDTLVIIARLIEIPGKFPPNDLYNYLYVMKYRVVKVVKGVFTGEEILVAHYNPLIQRPRIKDRMRPFVAGNVAKFETGDKHRLVLITPLTRVIEDRVEDEYADSDLDKYYALKADVAQ
jgi:hypothetical protein